MSKLETNTIDNISGSSTLTIGDSNASTISIPKNITLGASGTTITVPSGATITNNGTQTGFGGVMTPYFSAYRSGNQTISSQTNTKVEFNQELFDSDNTYDSTTNYRFTPTTAGKYWLNASAQLSGTLDTGTVYFYIQKNGSTLQGIDEKYIYSSISTSFSLETSCLVDANGSSDYFDCFFYRYAGSAPLRSGSAFTNFNGFKLIE